MDLFTYSTPDTFVSMLFFDALVSTVCMQLINNPEYEWLSSSEHSFYFSVKFLSRYSHISEFWTQSESGRNSIFVCHEDALNEGLGYIRKF